jgi:hypothetical protein
VVVESIAAIGHVAFGSGMSSAGVVDDVVDTVVVFVVVDVALLMFIG